MDLFKLSILFYYFVLYFIPQVAHSDIYTREDLIHLESKLQNELKELQENKYNSNLLYTKLKNEPLILEEIMEWHHRQKHFQENLDLYILKQQEYFLETSFENLKYYTNNLHNQNKDIFRIIQARDKYYNNINEYGKNKDYRRINSYVEYFYTYNKFLRSLKTHKQPDRQWSKKLKKLFLKEGFRHPGVVKELIFPRKRTHSAYPMTNLLNKLSTSIRNVFYKIGVEVSVEGTENIPTQSKYFIKNDKTVNIFAFQHGHGIIDELVKSHIPIPHYMVMWAVKIAPLPHFMHSRLEKSPSIIPVGSEKNNAIQATIDRIKNRYSNNIAIHPQGTLNIFNEILPVRENFSYKLIKELHSQGFKINLIPVSSQYAPNFLTGNMDDMMNYPSGRKIQVMIHPVISHKMLQNLLQFDEGYQILLYYIRSIWIEHSENNEHQIFGQMNTQAIETRMKDFI